MVLRGTGNKIACKKRFIRKPRLYGGFMVSFLKKYKEIILFMLAYWFLCFVMFFWDGSFLYVALSWNTFLAVLPLFFVKIAETAWNQGRNFRSVIYILLWLFFFPNSVYVATDFIHISGGNFMGNARTGKHLLNGGFAYGAEISAWVKLLVIGIGFLFALLVGLESLYIFEKNIKRKVSKLVCYSAISAIVLLSGIGVYIGRFLRFNSWDIFLRPVNLIKQVVTQIDRFFIQFVLIFSFFVMCNYLLYNVIFRRIIRQPDD